MTTTTATARATTMLTTIAIHCTVPMTDQQFPFYPAVHHRHHLLLLPSPSFSSSSCASLWLEIDLLCTDKSIFYCFICHHIYCFTTRLATCSQRLASKSVLQFCASASASFPYCCCCCCYYYCKPIEREKVKSAKATAKAVNP